MSKESMPELAEFYASGGVVITYTTPRGVRVTYHAGGHNAGVPIDDPEFAAEHWYQFDKSIISLMKGARLF